MYNHVLLQCIVIYVGLDVSAGAPTVPVKDYLSVQRQMMSLLRMRRNETQTQTEYHRNGTAAERDRNGTDFRRQAGNAMTTPQFVMTSTTRRRRTTPFRLSFNEDCDYLAYYCLRAYNTGKLCGRTLYYIYHDFHNYCMLDYVNCMERYEVWQVVHMGACFNIEPLQEYKHYPYENDYFLDQYYVVEDQI
ncbi:uncharacterized protein LOC126376708 [Pectinophora gossypiella]|uniref:uncharacterized protein LOC126376708 n=1 Tax=Pectinophora gossypiella TaxID=13191 RepID=UPI00214F09A1|nr:uncharacterized protein LOC126376708 [Pectinophora gossypiella]